MADLANEATLVATRRKTSEVTPPDFTAAVDQEAFVFGSVAKRRSSAPST